MVREHSRPWPSPTRTRARRRGRLGDRRPRASPSATDVAACLGFGARKRRRCRRSDPPGGDDDACARSSTPRRSHGSLLDASRASRRRRGPSRRPRPAFPARASMRDFANGNPIFFPGGARRDRPRPPRLPRTEADPFRPAPSHHPASIHSPSRSTRSRISSSPPSQGCEVGEDQKSGSKTKFKVTVLQVPLHPVRGRRQQGEEAQAVPSPGSARPGHLNGVRG